MSEAVTAGSLWQVAHSRHKVTVIGVHTIYEHEGPLVRFKITGGDTVTCTMKSFLEAHTPMTLDGGLRAAAEREADSRYPELVLAPENEQRADDFVEGFVAGAARVTPTQSQIESVIMGRTATAGAKAVLALMKELSEGESGAQTPREPTKLP